MTNTPEGLEREWEIIFALLAPALGDEVAAITANSIDALYAQALSAAQQDRERMREALEKIAAGEGYCGPGYFGAQAVARQALKAGK